MLKQGTEFHFDISVIRDKLRQENEGRLYLYWEGVVTMVRSVLFCKELYHMAIQFM